jgi:citrate/tricarballylate utilization protein
VAAFYENFMSRTAPYPLLGLPVMIGIIGGTMLMTGAGGLFIYKWRSDRAPSSPGFIGLDLAFSQMLFLISLSGLLLLVLRETKAMGLLLAVHFGLVLSFFLTLPYGKFVHALYRYAALVQNAIEEKEEQAG